MKPVMYHGLHIGGFMCSDIKASLYSFRNYCTQLHNEKFKNFSDLKPQEDLDAKANDHLSEVYKGLCTREEAFLKTGSYDTEIVISEFDEWFIICWESETRGNGNGQNTDESGDQ